MGFIDLREMPRAIRATAEQIVRRLYRFLTDTAKFLIGVSHKSVRAADDGTIAPVIRRFLS